MFSAVDVFLSDISYSAWANQQLLDASSFLLSEELERDLRLSHTSILSTLRHVCDGERVWLDALCDTADGALYVLPQGDAPQLSLNELKQCWPKLWDGYRTWIQMQIENNGLNSEILVEMPGGTPRLPRWKILRHVLDHSQFHRGQIVAMFRALGHCPPAINRMDHFWVPS